MFWNYWGLHAPWGHHRMSQLRHWHRPTYAVVLFKLECTQLFSLSFGATLVSIAFLIKNKCSLHAAHPPWSKLRRVSRHILVDRNRKVRQVGVWRIKATVCCHTLNTILKKTVDFWVSFSSRPILTFKKCFKSQKFVCSCFFYFIPLKVNGLWIMAIKAS